MTLNMDYGLAIAKYLLKEQGEFYPIGVYIDGDDKAQQFISLFGDDFPLSSELIKQLEFVFEEKYAKSEIKGYAVLYDSISKRNAESEKLDTVIAKFKHPSLEKLYLYFLPYEKINGDITFHDGWVEN